MQVNRLLDGVTASGNSETLTITPTTSPNYSRLEVPYPVFQVEITGTATVQIRGRTSTDMSWHVIDTLTSSGASRCTQFPLMDANVSSYSSGSVTVELAN
jgi:hypothetical protein